jgi:hypothetical protein
MGLVKFFRDTWTVAVYRALTRQLSELKAKGLDNVQAGAALVTGTWQVPVTYETPARTWLLSRDLGDLVIGC